MRKLIVLFLLFSASMTVHAQFPKMNNLAVVEAATSTGDFYNKINAISWPFIWDLSMDTFEDEFVIVEIKYSEKTNEPEYFAIARHKYDDGEAALVIHSNDEDKVSYFAPTDNHGELFRKIASDFFEIKDKSGFCASFETSYDRLGDPVSLKRVRDNDSQCYYYSEVDEQGRVTSFHKTGFTANDIINSQRKIRPQNPYIITYSESGLKEIKDKSFRISFRWEAGQILYNKDTYSRKNPQHIIHQINYSEPDEHGRWTKETLLDYDVILDQMVPVYTVKRIFAPADEFIQFKSGNFNPDKKQSAIPFQLVETKPSFNGGDANAFSKWVGNHLIYPEIAKENGIQGRVTVRFTINEDGRLSDVRVLRGIDPALDKEAVRVVSSSPKWKPGMIRGKVVPVTYTFPVIFQLR